MLSLGDRKLFRSLATRLIQGEASFQKFAKGEKWYQDLLPEWLVREVLFALGQFQAY